MEVLTIPVMVGEDRRLILDLPPATPLGPAEVTIRSRPDCPNASVHSNRTTARDALLAAGFLVTDVGTSAGMAPLSEEDIARLGRLPEGARSSEVLVAEDRGDF